MSGELELIDTLWNVNAYRGHADNAGRQRINRYIMECKSGIQ